MQTYHSLSPGDPKIVEHFLAMTPEDRRSRFHGLTSDERIVNTAGKWSGATTTSSAAWRASGWSA
jgi:hypothetical protein